VAATVSLVVAEESCDGKAKNHDDWKAVQRRNYYLQEIHQVPRSDMESVGDHKEQDDDRRRKDLDDIEDVGGSKKHDFQWKNCKRCAWNESKPVAEEHLEGTKTHERDSVD
jgi:hypothetical protein